VKKIYLIFLFLISVFPSFSQEIEMAGEAKMKQIWNSLSEEQKNDFVKIFEEKAKSDIKLSYFNQILNTLNEDERYSMRHFVGSHSHESEEKVVIEIARLNEKGKPIAEMFMAMTENEKQNIKNLLENEEEYYSARKKLILGIALNTGGMAMSGLFTGLFFAADDWYEEVMCIPFIIIGGGAFTAGIPFTIIGAVKTNKYRKYKPKFAFSPNGMKFVMSF